MTSTDWRHEMHNMLAAFNRQATHSLRIIKIAFKQSGLSFTPEFKQYFIQASNRRIIESYDEFEINSSLEEQLNVNVNSGMNVSNGSPGDNESLVVIDVASDPMNKTVQVDVVTEREHSGRSDFKLGANDIGSDSFNGGKSDASLANTLGTVIQIDDSDGEEGAVQIPKMEFTDGRATKNAASSNSAGMNQTGNQRGKDKVKIGIKNEGDIKPKQEKVDDDIPMIEIQVNRKVRVPFDEENTLGPANSSSFRTTNGNASTINSTHVKSDLENQPLNNLIEVDDSSDEEGATERAHTSNESMRKETSQMDFLVDLSNASSQVGQLGQSNISTTVTKRANDINSFHIGSTIIQSSESTARMGTSSEERCVGSDGDGNVVNASVDSNNVDSANSVRSINPKIVEDRNGTMNGSRSRSGNNEGIDASKENRRRNIDARLIDKKRQTNKTTMVASNPRPATEQSITNRFKCRHCKYVGRHMGHLNEHIRTHTGEKPYRCDRCGKRFTRMEHLRKHAVTHTDVFPFNCKGCFRGFSLKIEKEAHDNECKIRRYECHLCKKFVTFRKTLLKMHMLKHTGEKPFRCEICMMHFTAKHSLKRHLNTIHARVNQ